MRVSEGQGQSVLMLNPTIHTASKVNYLLSKQPVLYIIILLFKGLP